ncbi:MAG: SCO family protein [Xanthomonadales bacterium]|nr:SCO family protein [Xanthomonadales bacterium]
MSIFHLQGKWATHEDKIIDLKELAGKPVVAAMVYTSCQHTCPLITSKVISVRNSLPKKDQSKVTYALFSIDSEGDTPEALRRYKEKRNLDENWILLTADKRSVRQLAGVLGVNYKKMPDGGFSHSNIITLIDEKGVIVTQVNGLNADTSELSKRMKSSLD